MLNLPGLWLTYLSIHLDKIQEDHILSLHFYGFVKRKLSLGLDHLIQQLSTHSTEVLFPQVIL